MNKAQGIFRLPARVDGPLPRVAVNMAMTADGKIATANRRISSFGSQQDLAHLYQLRATADAIVCGAGTLTAEGARLDPGPARYQQQRRRSGRPPWALRVAVSGSGSIPPDAPIFRDAAWPVLVWCAAGAAADRLDRLTRVAREVWIGGEPTVDLRGALVWLRRERAVERVLVEGGARLNEALFRAGLVDELHVTLCPYLFGGEVAPTLADGAGVERLEEAWRWRLKRGRRCGNETFLVYERPAGTPAGANDANTSATPARAHPAARDQERSTNPADCRKE